MNNFSSTLCVLFLTLCASCVVYAESGENSLYSGLKVMYHAFSQCEDGNYASCLKMRALKFVDRIVRQDEVSVIDGLSFQKVVEEENGSRSDSGRAMSDETLKEIEEKNLPEDPEKRDEAIDELLIDRLGRFFTTHSLKFSMPRYLGEVFNSEVQGRGSGGGGGGGGNKKGGGELLWLASMVGGGMGTLAIKGLALLTGMALVAAKIALVTSAVIGLSKLFQHGDEKTTFEVVTKHKHHGGDERSMRVTDPHYLVYNGHLEQIHEAGNAPHMTP